MIKAGIVSDHVWAFWDLICPAEKERLFHGVPPVKSGPGAAPAGFKPWQGWLLSMRAGDGAGRGRFRGRRGSSLF